MTGTHTGSSVGDAVRKGVGMFHGAGEAIRGNINAAVDSASGDRDSAARQQQIASSGLNEMEHGHQPHSHRATGVGHHPEQAGSTNYGPHSSNTANKMDPRFDSDLDNRGTTTGSTNYGPHSTNMGNKMDPRFDSDLDNRGTQTGSTNYGPHDTNIGNKMDPRFDSDLGTRR
ncbi:hypothetical protein GQ43DRAFT_373167 [Delitschia confertaspora ATCC 74209]|uniref:Uncharacterized protein n=1 Tax=Delitschia confertaspora ATCC 74209 TaxID=1513339 RepID=A0A9P4JP53_9PLEO|nr:hypothetical protein GQ43DRAFT_373167 [Delitschia confertaspora ATCC 74209]